MIVLLFLKNFKYDWIVTLAWDVSGVTVYSCYFINNTLLNTARQSKKDAAQLSQYEINAVWKIKVSLS